MNSTASDACLQQKITVSLFKPFLFPLTLSQLVRNERALSSVLRFRLGDHHGGERGDEAVLQGHLQRLSRSIDLLIRGTALAARMKIILKSQQTIVIQKTTVESPKEYHNIYDVLSDTGQRAEANQPLLQ